MKNFTDWLKEEVAANAAGLGGVAGIGVGEKGEPGVKLKRKKLADGIDPSEVESLSETYYVWVCRKCKAMWGPADDKKVPKKCYKCGSTDADLRDDSELLDEDADFAGAPVFDVDMDTLMKSRFGKSRYHRYSRYVGEDETGEAIRKTGRETSKDIVLKDKGTGAMMYLRRKDQPKS